MARKYSLTYLTIPGTDPVEQIRIAKETGYDFVSLRTIPMHLPGEPEFLMHKDQALFEATKKALKDYYIRYGKDYNKINSIINCINTGYNS